MHLNIKQEGRVSACWRYQGTIGDYRNESLEAMWNNDKMRELRRAHLHGEQPIECRSCWDFEKSGIESPRNTSNEQGEKLGVTEENMLETMGNDYTMPIEHLTKVELRFDNICNLMCRHCSPVFSSRWHSAIHKDADLRSEFSKHSPLRKEDKHVKLTDEIIAEAENLSNHVTHFMVSGGEPLIHPKHYTFLENILHNADKIHLDYNSNLHTLEFKGKDILNLWKQFKSFQIRVSIDGYPDIYEYKRVDSNLDAVCQNIQRLIDEMPEAQIHTTCTTSVLNITRLTKIFEFYNSIGGGLHTSLVQTPKALNPKILPALIKEEITDIWNDWIVNAEDNITRTAHPRITEHESGVKWQVDRATRYGNYVVNYMNSEDRFFEWKMFKGYISAQDRYHNTNVLDVYPEFKPYWD